MAKGDPSYTRTKRALLKLFLSGCGSKTHMIDLNEI